MRTSIRVLSFMFSLTLALNLVGAAAQAAGVTQVKYYGHAAFEITTPNGLVLFVDPWLKNPLDPAAKDSQNNPKDPIDSIAKADYILVTHGHFDHVGDSVELAKKTNAKLVTNFELGSAMVSELGYPKNLAGMDTLFNIGGRLSLGNGEVVVTMVPAIHSSGLSVGSGDHEHTVYGGTAAGFVIQVKNGPTIYDTGDTAYFDDMKLIGEEFAPDLALINIGGHFGMEPDMAARAASAVKAKYVVPHHYKTFPVLTQSADGFFKLLDKKHVAHQELAPGSSISFEGKKLKK